MAAAGFVYTEWAAPSSLPITGIFSSGGWSSAAQRLGNQLNQRGWRTRQVTWDFNSLMTPYRLIVRAEAPQGINAAEQFVADEAERAGFSVDRSAISFKVGAGAFGGNPSDDSNPFGLPSLSSPLMIGAAVLFGIVVIDRIID